VRKSDREGSVVADIPESALMLEGIWKDKVAREAMAASAHAAWERSFTWEIIADQYEALYLALQRGEDIKGQFNPPPEVV
jgi:glycosyltransferase involved in cell wall biosynthesis